MIVENTFKNNNRIHEVKQILSRGAISVTFVFRQTEQHKMNEFIYGLEDSIDVL